VEYQTLIASLRAQLAAMTAKVKAGQAASAAAVAADTSAVEVLVQRLAELKRSVGRKTATLLKISKVCRHRQRDKTRQDNKTTSEDLRRVTRKAWFSSPPSGLGQHGGRAGHD
jgi:hypothetical protein